MQARIAKISQPLPTPAPDPDLAHDPVSDLGHAGKIKSRIKIMSRRFCILWFACLSQSG